MRRVFWPKTPLSPDPGIVVGWKNGPNDYVVTAILPYIEVHLAERVLARDHLLKGSKSPSELFERFNGDKLKVLATTNHKQDGCDFNVVTTPELLVEFADAGHCIVIRYEPPNAHRLSCLSVDPIKLELRDDSGKGAGDGSSSGTAETTAYAQLMHNIALQSPKLSQTPTPLKTCISQINCSHELSSLLVSNAEKLFPELRRDEPPVSRARQLSISARKLSFEAGKRASTGVNGVLRYVFAVLISIFVVVRTVADRVLSILNRDFSGYTLCHISLTAQQIDLNLRRLCYFPEQYLVVRKRRHIWFTQEYNEEYIRFYNNLWLGFNDRMFGWSMGSILAVSDRHIVDGYLYFTQEVLGRKFCDQIFWLMNWPGGLKLHDEITIFLGNVIVWTAQTWQGVCLGAVPAIRVLVRIVAFLGIYGGVTLQIAVFCDVIALVSLPFYNFYVSFAKLYHNTLGLFLSLFRLFRGKKWNVLRQRVDSEDYDMSQLFLGTILFTVLLFLLPTILVFYTAFTIYRLLIIFASGSLEMVLGFFNHFPLFLLLLRIKSPGRIPGGLRVTFDAEASTHQTTLSLSSYPLTLGLIFHQYNMVARQFTTHYLSFKVLSGLLTGGVVTIQRGELYKILYSMLPKERTPTDELYRSLKKDLLGDDLSHARNKRTE